MTHREARARGMSVLSRRSVMPSESELARAGRRRRLRALCAVGTLLIGVTACGEGSGGTGSTTTAATSGSTGAAARPDGSPVDVNSKGTEVRFDPANFVDPTLDTNPFHPLKPGLQWVRGGTTEVGKRVVPHEIITTMTDVVRVIDGVTTIAMLDESTDSGEVSQVGMDYLALDKDGNVWILGGYTEEFEGGDYTNTESAFLGTDGGAEVGILSPAHVDASTPRWFISAPPGEKASVGQVVSVGTHECSAFGCYDNVRVVQEGNVGAPDNENKYYAPGVGVIKNVPLDASLHQDRFELLNFLALSSTGLAEASKTVQDLEAHARRTSPDVFGSAPRSKRGS